MYLLLFWSLDRFSREGVLETLTSLKRLSDYGVKYRSLQKSYIDTTNPFGDLLAAFVAKIAALERERIRISPHRKNGSCEGELRANCRCGAGG